MVQLDQRYMEEVKCGHASWSEQEQVLTKGHSIEGLFRAS